MGENKLLDEVLFMQLRLFRMFIQRTGMTSSDANALWKAHDVWSFISEFYDMFHTEGDEAVYDNVLEYLHAREVSV
jgi:predicted glycosyltransferase